MMNQIFTLKKTVVSPNIPYNMVVYIEFQVGDEMLPNHVGIISYINHEIRIQDHQDPC